MLLRGNIRHIFDHLFYSNDENVTSTNVNTRFAKYMNSRPPASDDIADQSTKLIYCPLDPVCPVYHHVRAPKPTPSAGTRRARPHTRSQGLDTSISVLNKNEIRPEHTLRNVVWMKYSSVLSDSDYEYPDGLQFTDVEPGLFVASESIGGTDSSSTAPLSTVFISACELALSQINTESLKVSSLGDACTRVPDSVFMHNLGFAGFINSHFFDTVPKELDSTRNLRLGGKVTSRVLKFPCPMRMGTVIIDPDHVPASCYLYTYSSVDYDNPYAYYPRSTFLSCVYAQVANQNKDDILSRLKTLFGSSGMGSFYEFHSLSSTIMSEKFSYSVHHNTSPPTADPIIISFHRPTVHTYIHNIKGLRTCHESNSWYLPNCYRFPIIDAMAISQNNVLILLQITTSDRHDISVKHHDDLINQVVSIAKSRQTARNPLDGIAFVIFTSQDNFAMSNYVEYVKSLNRKLVRNSVKVRAYSGLHIQKL
jgi:hypothetical protein